VPVPLPDNASPGFLRDINFQALAGTIIDGLFGEVPRPSWFEVTLGSRPDSDTGHFLFTVVVRLREHTREIDVGPDPTSGKRILRHVGVQRDRETGFDFPIPREVVRQMRADLPAMFTTWLEQGLLATSHRMFEADPRIGWRFSGNGGLPISRILDPSVPFSRVGVPVEWEPTTGAPPDPHIKPPRCPFCREPHTWAEPPVWAGGNLLWVHGRCWGAS